MAPSSAGAQSPRQSARGVLNSTYEGKFGGALQTLRQDTAGSIPISAVATPRGRAKVNTVFSDAANPFDRRCSKKITDINVHRADDGRAGGRTRNPGMIRQEQGPGGVVERGSPLKPSKRDGAQETPRTVPFRYSTAPDYKPGKAFGGATPGQTPGSPIAPSDHQGALANYLNDMKASSSSRRAHQQNDTRAHASEGAWGPSSTLQHMNNMRVKLAAEVRDESRERAPPDRTREDFHFDSAASPTAEKLFASKRSVSESPLSSPKMLQHVNGGAVSRESSVQRRMERLQQADIHGDTVKQHMQVEWSQSRTHFEHFRARGNQGMGIFPDAVCA